MPGITINYIFKPLSCSSSGARNYYDGNYAEAIKDFTNGIEAPGKGTFSELAIEKGKIYYNRAIAYFQLGNYESAIADLNKAASSTLFLLLNQDDYFYAYGVIYAKQENISAAFNSFYLASRDQLRHNNGCFKEGSREAIAIATLVQNIALADPKTLIKNTLFGQIKWLPMKQHIPLLKQCLDQSTDLGKFFWRSRKGTACSLSSGTLKDIVEYLKETGNYCDIVAPPSPKKDHFKFLRPPVSKVLNQLQQPTNETETEMGNLIGTESKQEGIELTMS